MKAIMLMMAPSMKKYQDQYVADVAKNVQTFSEMNTPPQCSVAQKVENVAVVEGTVGAEMRRRSRQVGRAQMAREDFRARRPLAKRHSRGEHKLRYFRLLRMLHRFLTCFVASVLGWKL